MQLYYLSRNQHGYFRVRFTDPVTGKLSVAKSTHSKNRTQAAHIAEEWLREREATGTGYERISNCPASVTDLETFVKNLSLAQAQNLAGLLSQSFNLQALFPTLSDTAKTPLPVENPVQNKSDFNSENNLVKTPVTKNTAPALPDGEKPVYLIETLMNFWDFENSEYVKKRIARGYDIKQRNCKEKLGIVKRYWVNYFDKTHTVQSLTSRELDDFLMYLRTEKGLSADTVNKTMTAGNMPFEFLVKEGLIKANPMVGVERFKVTARKRGIPTETEMKQLIALDWNWTDSAYKLAFKVAALFGLRAGEISGLQVCDVDAVADLLYIRHSWNDVDKLKDTKNGDDRTIPIEHVVALELLANARRNPEYSDTSYVFWSPKISGQPMWPSSFEDDFYRAMREIGISEEQRKERNIVFHSLRHFCATQIAQRASLEIAMKILGHRTEEMTRLYSEHETQMKLNNAKEVLSQGWAILGAA